MEINNRIERVLNIFRMSTSPHNTPKKDINELSNDTTDVINIDGEVLEECLLILEEIEKVNTEVAEGTLSVETVDNFVGKLEEVIHELDKEDEEDAKADSLGTIEIEEKLNIMKRREKRKKRKEKLKTMLIALKQKLEHDYNANENSEYPNNAYRELLRKMIIAINAKI